MKHLALDINGQTIEHPEGFAFGTSSVGTVLGELLPYILGLAGIILFLYLIWGGFELLTSGGNPETMARGKGKIGHAVVGFILVFASYWIAQIIQHILGIEILG